MWTLISLLILSTCCFLISANAPRTPTIDQKVLDQISSWRRTTAILRFRGPTVSDVLRRYRPRPGHTNNPDLSELLRANSNTQQAKTLRFLQSQRQVPGSPLDFIQLWMLNQIVVKNLDFHTLRRLNRSDEIVRIQADDDFRVVDLNRIPNGGGRQRPSVQWGVEAIRAPDYWAQGYTGEGVTIGIMDTGIRSTHRSLRDRCPPSYPWLDAVNGRPSAYDDHGHGTHIAAIASGINGVGVAPNSTVIACKFIDSQGRGNISSALTCAQFLFCPTNGFSDQLNCNRRPKVISNSWSLTHVGSNGFFNEVIDVWVAAGIVTVFAAGDSGPWCGTIDYPAQYPSAIAVGAVDTSSRVTWFSSRGPVQRRVKPDFVAPGMDIFSASNANDHGLVPMSGTGSAAAHAAGAVALLLSRFPNLNQDTARKYIQRNALAVTPSNETCQHVSDRVYPNNLAGSGKIVLR